MPDGPVVAFVLDFHFLSNFHPAPVEMDGMTYPTVEHAFQAAKTEDPALRAMVRGQPTPGMAKKAGRALTKLRPGWNEMRVDVMRALVRRKFETHPDLAARLLATGDRELVEGNTWRDSFWGVYRGLGENWLGRILMEVRAWLRSAGGGA